MKNRLKLKVKSKQGEQLNAILSFEQKLQIILLQTQMEGYIGEEQQDMISGWDDTDESPMYVKICVRGPLQSSEESSLRKAETAHQKLPFKQHRRSSSKPVVTHKPSDKNILRIDRQILNKYLTRQSEKNILDRTQQYSKKVDSQQTAQVQPKYDRKSVSGINFELNKCEDLRGIKNELFSGVKSQKKNRRKFYAKSKILDEVQPSFFDQKLHRKRISSKVASKNFDFEQCNQPFIHEQWQEKKENKPKRVPSRKKRTFPMFFRQLQMQQKEQEKKLYKRILEQKIRQRKNGTHFMLASSKPFINSIEFTDTNIFPPKFIRT